MRPPGCQLGYSVSVITPEDLTEWADYVREADEAARHNARGRDAAIRQALTEGMSVSAAARATGLTRARIVQVRAG